MGTLTLSTDEIKFGVNRLVKQDDQSEEDEDNNNTYHSKPISCDSPTNLSVTRSRSNSRHGSRSRSSSSELEVDSPPPPPRINDSPSIIEVGVEKKSNGFSMSALLRNDDQPKLDKALTGSSFTPLR